MTEDELTRLAFICGEQDRRSFADCWPPKSKERKAAAKLADAMHAYRVKRWGRTKLEAVLDGAKPVSIHDIKRGAR